MKKITLFMLMISFISFSQQEKIKNLNKYESLSFNETNKNPNNGLIRCATVEYGNRLEKRGLAPTAEEFENWLAPKLEEYKANRAYYRQVLPVVSIPTVVHVVHNGDALGTNENILDGQVLSQIEVFNNDFRKLAGTPGDGGGVDTLIEFCMAQTAPDGSATNGITRTNLGIASFDSAAVDGTLKPSTIWDPTQYMNMWTCVFGGDLNGVLGFAQFPSGSGLPGMPGAECEAGGSASTDGVIAGYGFFGSRTIFPGGNYGDTTYDKGRTMTHEVGHMFGLRHIWGDGDCTVDDFCADTPNAGAANFGCPNVDSCTGGGADQVENYMDYSDDTCMNMYTQDQADRMMTVLLNSPRRDDLLVSNKCSAPTAEIAFKSIDCSDTSVTDIVVEMTSCTTFTDINIPIVIDLGPSQNATVTASRSAGSATEGVDFDFVNSPLNFPAGSGADQDLVVRIYNDAIPSEGDETLDITLSVNANGGNATLGANSLFSLTIQDDDVAPTPLASLTNFSQNFETLGAWTTDSANFFQAPDQGWGTGTIMASDGTARQTPVQNLSSGLINIPANATNIRLGFLVNCFTAGSSETLEVYLGNAPFTLTTNVFNQTYTTGVADPRTESVNLDAYAGQNVHITFSHPTVRNGNYLLLDDAILTYDIATGIQTVDNTAAPDEVPITVSGTHYTSDPTTFYLMLDINSGFNHDYGCVDIAVSRNSAANGGATIYTSATITDYALSKTFDVTATNTSTRNSDITFYYTEAEVSAWEGLTGNTRNNLLAHKVGVEANLPLSIGAFGSDVTFTASFSSGISGTYILAPLQAACASVDSTEEINPGTGYVAGTSLTICEGAAAGIQPTVPSGANPTYSWVGPNTFTQNTRTVDLSALTAADSGVYTVTVNMDGSCASTDYNFNVTINPTNPDLTTSVEGQLNGGGYVAGTSVTATDGDMVELRLPSSAFNGTWQWYNPAGTPMGTGETQIVGAAVVDADPTQEGTWQVTATFTNDCARMAPQTIDFDVIINPLLTTNFNEFDGLAIYPNPTSDLINISSSTNLNNTNLSLVDLRGRIVLNKLNDTLSNNISLDLSEIAQGSYFLIIENDTKKSVRQIIKK